MLYIMAATEAKAAEFAGDRPYTLITSTKQMRVLCNGKAKPSIIHVVGVDAPSAGRCSYYSCLAIARVHDIPVRGYE